MLCRFQSDQTLSLFAQSQLLSPDPPPFEETSGEPTDRGEAEPAVSSSTRHDFCGLSSRQNLILFVDAISFADGGIHPNLRELLRSECVFPDFAARRLWDARRRQIQSDLHRPRELAVRSVPGTDPFVANGTETGNVLRPQSDGVRRALWFWSTVAVQTQLEDHRAVRRAANLHRHHDDDREELEEDGVFERKYQNGSGDGDLWSM